VNRLVVKECGLAQRGGAKVSETAAFAAVFEGYQARIFRYLRSLVGEPALAEDLAQDTFVKAYKALAQGHPPDNLNAWLYAIATNTALSALRRRRLIAWLPLQASPEAHEKPGAADHEGATGEQELINQVLAALPKTDAACLWLRFQHDLSYAELAHVLGTTVPAAKMRLSRARAAFRELYLRLNQEAEA
jgi:RNA polymerase sigma-70 factor, ECF subfamily